MTRDELIRPVPALLKEHDELAPERVAYADSAHGVTYADPERRTRPLAGHLTRTGLARGDRVAIIRGNRVEMVESCLAVLRAGMVGVPLDPRSSDAELAHFLKDGRAAFVITDAAHLGRLRRLGPPYDGLGALVAGPGPVPDGARSFHSAVESDEPAEIDTLGLDDPARMLYTSGTTHRPKACCPRSGPSCGPWPPATRRSKGCPRTRRERAERAVRIPPSSRIVRDP